MLTYSVRHRCTSPSRKVSCFFCTPKKVVRVFSRASNNVAAKNFAMEYDMSINTLVIRQEFGNQYLHSHNKIQPRMMPMPRT